MWMPMQCDGTAPKYTLLPTFRNYDLPKKLRDNRYPPTFSEKSQLFQLLSIVDRELVQYDAEIASLNERIHLLKKEKTNE